MGSRNASLCTDVGTARQSLTMLHGAVRSDLGCSWLPLQHMLSSAGDMQLLPLPHKLGPGRNNQELQLEPLDVAKKRGKAEQKLQWPKPQGRGQTKPRVHCRPCSICAVLHSAPACTRKLFSLAWMGVNPCKHMTSSCHLGYFKRDNGPLCIYGSQEQGSC